MKLCPHRRFPQSSTSFPGTPVFKLLKGKHWSYLIMETFPEHKWQVWKFSRAPEGWWDKMDNQRMFLEAFAAARGMKSMNDWYNVDFDSLAEFNGKKYNSVFAYHMLKSHFLYKQVEHC